MPVQVARRLPEAGRIRIGVKGDRGQPQRLQVFRLTSKDRVALEGAAQIWGGTVKTWPAHEGEYELITQVKEIPILISPEPYTQWYELWAGGGCKKRCDGETCSVPKGDGLAQVPCSCDPTGRECKLVTRASFLLPDLPVLGIWRLDTSSYYAAVELPGILDLLVGQKHRGVFPEAVLTFETRRVMRNGKAKIFPVVTIKIRETVRQLLGRDEAPVSRQIESAPSATRVIEARSDDIRPMNQILGEDPC